MNEKDQIDYKLEVEYVAKYVTPKRHMLREKKDNYDLLMDARYFNKYRDYLYNRILSKNFY